MIESDCDASTGSRRFILRPNASLTARQVNLFLAAAAAVMGSIAAGFAVLGLWPVLPFSGAEWLLLAWCFRESVRNGSACEVITIDAATVLVEQGRGRPNQTHRFQRAWVALEWIAPGIPGHPSELVFRLHGRRVVVGRFLAEAEREALARELQKILADQQI